MWLTVSLLLKYSWMARRRDTDPSKSELTWSQLHYPVFPLPYFSWAGQNQYPQEDGKHYLKKLLIFIGLLELSPAFHSAAQQSCLTLQFFLTTNQFMS